MSFQTDFKIPASATNDIKYSTIFENCLKCETVGHKIDLLEKNDELDSKISFYFSIKTMFVVSGSNFQIKKIDVSKDFFFYSCFHH
jgi:hypothetical protein